jgi:hypothetical protein
VSTSFSEPHHEGKAERQIAFVLGCARSGTSILGELIGAHPVVAYLFEAHGVWEPPGSPPPDHHRLTASDAKPAVVERVRRRLLAKAGHGRVVVEKNPRHALRVPFLRAAFPEAVFIHVVRDGRDVACSMLPGVGGEDWWHLRPPDWREHFERAEGLRRCAFAWRGVMEIVLEDLAAVPALEVRFERLVRAPERTAQEVLSFLGLASDPAVEAFCTRVSDDTAAPYHSDSRKWFRGDHQVRVGRWREYARARPVEMAQAESIMHDVLVRLEYEPELS